MGPIPYGRQDVSKEDVKSVNEVLFSDYLTQGPKVSEFESKFAEYVGSKYAVAVSSATAALHISAKAIGLQSNQRVITTPISFAATSNCIRYLNGEVWFADIDPNNYLISLDEIEALIQRNPQNFFSGIIPVNFGGLMVDLERLRVIASKYNLWVIEDASHSPGAFFTDSNGNKVKSGNGKYTDLSVFSFHPVKHIACGEGGMITTNCEKLMKRLQILRTHGIAKEDYHNELGGWYYDMFELGFNYRITDIQCALGINQLLKNDKGVDKRNHIANKYKEAFSGRIKFQELPDRFHNAHHLFVIEVNDRKGLYDFLRENNIFAQIHYIPIHKLSYYKKIGYGDAKLSNSEKYYQSCISLPMFPKLKDGEIDFVIRKVLEFVSKS